MNARISRISKNGTLVWTKNIADSTSFYLSLLILSPDNGVFASGYINGDMTAAFKFYMNGTLAWKRKLSSSITNPKFYHTSRGSYDPELDAYWIGGGVIRNGDTWHSPYFRAIRDADGSDLDSFGVHSGNVLDIYGRSALASDNGTLYVDFDGASGKNFFLVLRKSDGIIMHETGYTTFDLGVSHLLSDGYIYSTYRKTGGSVNAVLKRDGEGTILWVKEFTNVNLPFVWEADGWFGRLSDFDDENIVFSARSTAAGTDGVMILMNREDGSVTQSKLFNEWDIPTFQNSHYPGLFMIAAEDKANGGQSILQTISMEDLDSCNIESYTATVSTLATGTTSDTLTEFTIATANIDYPGVTITDVTDSVTTTEICSKDYFQCFGYGNVQKSVVCSGRGNCSAEHVCDCETGFYGRNCEFEKNVYTVIYSSDYVASTNCSTAVAEMITVRNADCIEAPGQAWWSQYCNLGANQSTRFTWLLEDPGCAAHNHSGFDVEQNADCDVLAPRENNGTIYGHEYCGDIFANETSRKVNVTELKQIGFFWELYRSNDCADGIVDNIWRKWGACLPDEMGGFSRFYCLGDTVTIYRYSDGTLCTQYTENATYSNLLAQPCQTGTKHKIPYSYSCPYDDSFTCSALPSWDRATCSGHGTCAGQDTCECDSEWTGAPDCSLATNETKMQCHGEDFDNYGVVCSGHGTCSAEDDCTCDDHYIGESCSVRSYFKFLKGSRLFNDPSVSNYTCDLSTSFPGARSRGMAFSFPDYVSYLFGGHGVDGDGGKGYWNDVWRWRTTGDGDEQFCFVKGSEKVNETTSDYSQGGVAIFDEAHVISSRSSFGGFSSVFSFLVFGGEIQKNMETNELWEFKIGVSQNAHQWRILYEHVDDPNPETQPRKRSGLCSAKKNNQFVYFFGGEETVMGGQKSKKNDFWSFDLVQNEFQLIRNGTTTNETDIAGQGNVSFTGLTSMEYSADLIPFVRRDHICWVDEKAVSNMFIFGGTLGNDESSNDVWVFNSTIGQWAYVTGGGSSGLETNQIATEYDFASGNFPSIRSGPSLFSNQEVYRLGSVGDDEIYFFGGMSVTSGFSSAGVWGFSNILMQFKFVNGTNKFNREGEGDYEIGTRGYALSVVKRNKKILIFGGEAGVLA